VAVADKLVAVAGFDRLAETDDILVEVAGKLAEVAGKLVEVAGKPVEVAGKLVEVAGKLVEVVDNLVEVVGSGNLCTSWRGLDFVSGRRHIVGSTAGLAYVLDETWGGNEETVETPRKERPNLEDSQVGSPA